QPGPGLIHHTDRGGQYAGDEYRGVLGRARMRQSMSRADNVYDNAFMESCFGTIKTELEMEVYANLQTAYAEIRDYLCYYDTKRRHSSLGYLTPYEFELSQKEAVRLSHETHETSYSNGNCPSDCAAQEIDRCTFCARIVAIPFRRSHCLR